MRRMLCALAGTLLLIGSLAGPAAAGRPDEVTFVNDLSTIEWFGPFTATGPAVDDGTLCASGIVASVGDRPWPTGPRYPEGFFTVGVYKLVFCDGDDPGVDGFVIRLQARCFPGVGTTFTWEIIDGWGRFARLHGQGTGTGAYGPDVIVDTYMGQLHLD